MVHKSRLALISIVLIIAVVNIIQFSAIDSDTSGRYRALDRKSTSDIMQLGVGTGEIAREYQFYLELSEIAPGAHLLLEESNGFTLPEIRTYALSLGEASLVEAAELSNSNPSADETVESTLVAANGNGSFGDTYNIPWQIITRECDEPKDPDAPRVFVVAFEQEAFTPLLSATETCTLPSMEDLG